MDRLKKFFYEAKKHKEHILEAKEELSFPVKDYENLPKIEKFALNTLIFRFSKLQDLLGTKIFRAYLEIMGYPINESSFFDILKEIEKEGIVDIDTWNYLRELRNNIAHDYPEELDEVVEKINLFVQKSDELLKILDRVEKKYDKTNTKRD